MNAVSYLKLHRTCLAFLLALSAADAAAAKWYFMNLGQRTAAYFYDAQSVQKNQTKVRVWIKTYRTFSADEAGSWVTAVHDQYDCAERTRQTSTAVLYGKDGAYLDSVRESGRPSEVVPGTVGERIMAVVCSTGFPYNAAHTNKAIDNDPAKTVERFITLLQQAPINGNP